LEFSLSDYIFAASGQRAEGALQRAERPKSLSRDTLGIPNRLADDDPGWSSVTVTSFAQSDSTVWK
jgi:hypothetical protein